MNLRWTFGFVLGASACVDSASVGSTGPAEGTSGEASTGDPQATVGGTGPATGGETCPEHPDFMCSQPLECPPGGSCNFGERFSPFDAQGCLRPSCSDEAPCPDGFTCMRGEAWGACGSSFIECVEDEDGVCSCGGNDDCQPISHCVPEGDVPPPACQDPGEGNAFEFDPPIPEASQGTSTCTVGSISNTGVDLTCEGSYAGSTTLRLNNPRPLGVTQGDRIRLELWVQSVDGWTNEWLQVSTAEGEVDFVLAIASQAQGVVPPGDEGTWFPANVVVTPTELDCGDPIACGGGGASMAVRGLRFGGAGAELDLAPGETADAIPGEFGGESHDVAVFEAREGGCAEFEGQSGWYSYSIVVTY